MFKRVSCSRATFLLDESFDGGCPHHHMGGQVLLDKRRTRQLSSLATGTRLSDSHDRSNQSHRPIYLRTDQVQRLHSCCSESRRLLMVTILAHPHEAWKKSLSHGMPRLSRLGQKRIDVFCRVVRRLLNQALSIVEGYSPHSKDLQQFKAFIFRPHPNQPEDGEERRCIDHSDQAACRRSSYQNCQFGVQGEHMEYR